MAKGKYRGSRAIAYLIMHKDNIMHKDDQHLMIGSRGALLFRGVDRPYA
ncbi:MAG: hypothetical protein AAFQ57_17605 [Cyanobacteria bacterium J06626_14]